MLMKKAEIIIATLSLLAVGMNIFLISGGSTLCAMLLMTLSAFYFYFGFALFNDIKIREIVHKETFTRISTLRIIGAIGSGMALCISIIGILFKLFSWPGANVLLYAGLIGLLFVSLIGLSKYLTNKSSFYLKILRRTIIVGVFGLILFLLPNMSIMEFKYRNYPEYINAYKKACENPDNEDLWKIVDTERQKIYNGD